MAGSQEPPASLPPRAWRAQVLDRAKTTTSSWRGSTPASRRTGRGVGRRPRPGLGVTLALLRDPGRIAALLPGKHSIHRTAGYVTRSSGGGGGRGREASASPD